MHDVCECPCLVCAEEGCGGKEDPDEDYHKHVSQPAREILNPLSVGVEFPGEHLLNLPIQRKKKGEEEPMLNFKKETSIESKCESSSWLAEWKVVIHWNVF